MSPRVMEWNIKFLKSYALSFSLYKTHGDVPPLNPSRTENLELLCVQVSH